jgi:hypothetical protein
LVGGFDAGLGGLPFEVDWTCRTLGCHELHIIGGSPLMN